MEARESESEITYDELMVEAAKALVPPHQENYELTYKDISRITGRDERSCKYYMEKWHKAKLVTRRKVVCSFDNTIQLAYSPRSGNSKEDWKELIAKLKE